MCIELYICLNRGRGKGNLEKKCQQFKQFFCLQWKDTYRIKLQTEKSKFTKGKPALQISFVITYVNFFVFMVHFCFFTNCHHFLFHNFTPPQQSFSYPMLANHLISMWIFYVYMVLAVLFSLSTDGAPEFKLFGLGSSTNYRRIRPMIQNTAHPPVIVQCSGGAGGKKVWKCPAWHEE